ncbi:unnamed protein product [Parascedosporium putredinis]|uniref:Uncharacterized protein n=1 Tax=Parascedosporium putredinis TaxID=1442378 RepID=A0A9P1H852_9PEZI|nr:unnamed protein product [Parascedosporium putredinis]CAI7999043.1 unnamed protein product [Parascedosporium putredinis]
MEAEIRDEDYRLGSSAIDDPLSQHRPSSHLQQPFQHQPYHQQHLYSDFPTQRLQPADLASSLDPHHHPPYADPTFPPHPPPADARLNTAQPARTSASSPGRRYTDANLSAVAANDRAAIPIDPHDFYRSYQDTNTGALVAHELDSDLPMATTAPSRGQDTSSPSTAAHSSSRLPSGASSSRTPLRQNLRSVSAPLGDDRSSTNPSKAGSAGQPSVKDLRKKFDQGGSASMIPRPPARSSLVHRPTYSSRSRATTPTGGPSTTNTAAGQSSSTASSRSSSSRNQSSITDPTRSSRPKSSQNNNGQSFANRVNKPKSSTSSKSTGTRSTTQSSRERAPASSSSSAVSHSRNPSRASQPILFGEILPDQRDTLAVGYGIENALPRAPSDTDSDSRRRTFSDMGDGVPDSPTDWYRPESARRASELSTRSSATLHPNLHDGSYAGAAPPSSPGPAAGQLPPSQAT